MSSVDRLATVLKAIPHLVVAGAQWGDEGKGKIVALLALIYDIIYRYSGASNAGHTFFTKDGKKLVTHQIPSGLDAGKTCIIGRGVMFDPVRFAVEYEEALAILGDRMPKVLVDHQATVWTPWASMFEEWIENCRGEHKIDSTKRGVSPMAALRDLRIDIKVRDILGPREALLEKLALTYRVLIPILREVSRDVPTPAAVANQLRKTQDLLQGKTLDTSLELYRALQQRKTLLGEGAQATMLDRDWGTNPYVSSGMSTAAGASYGSGLPPWVVNEVILVAKFCPTRVGEGPFPSEIWNRTSARKFAEDYPEFFKAGPVRDGFLQRARDKINLGSATQDLTSQYFQVLGDERGASTGRGRSVGYCDLPVLSYAQRINGAKYLALTRLDMMSGQDEIPVVVDYRPHCPRGSMPTCNELYTVRPLLKRFRGWKNNIQGATKENDLPREAKEIMRMIESETGMHILLVGTGPKLDDIIVREP